MKKLQQLCAVVILTFVLSLSTLAGDMGCPGDVPPPPPPTDQTTLTGDMGCPGAADPSNTQTPDVTVVDPLTQTILNLLPSVLSLL